MDIWDSLRVVRRQWRVALPIVVVGLILSAIAYSMAPTTWRVQTSVILLGPSQNTREVDGILVEDELNPYFEAGFAMPLTRVLVPAMKDPAITNQILAAGFSPDFTMEWDNRQPLISTTVVADTPEAARGTAQFLLERMEEDLAARQTAKSVVVEEQAVMDELSFSSAKENFRTPRMVFAIGLVLTLLAAVGAALGLEAWQRRDEYETTTWTGSDVAPPTPERVVSVVRDDVASAVEVSQPDGSDSDSTKSSRWQRRTAN